MRHTDLKRKRPTVWPWVIGLMVLGLIVLGVTNLLGPAPEEEPLAIPPSVVDSFPPAAIPSTGGGATPASEARPLDDLSPLSEEDVGQSVRAEGEVLATGNTGFWMLAGSQVLRVDSDRSVRKNDSVTVNGVVRPAENERTDRIASEILDRSPRSGSWQVIRAVKLVDRGAREPEANGQMDNV